MILGLGILSSSRVCLVIRRSKLSGWISLDPPFGCPRIIKQASTSSQVPLEIWSLIWGIKCPPKIRKFLWCALRRGLATNENLYRRRVRSSPLCALCHQYEESVKHILLLCPWVSPVWFGGVLSMRICKSEITTMCEWLLKVVIWASLNKADLAHVANSIAFTCWIIWKFRCKVVIEGRPMSPLATIFATELEFVDAVTATRLDCPSPTLVETTSYAWIPPVLHRVKINLDVAWSPTSNQGGIGLVVRDYMGTFFLAMAIPCMANSVQEAEALAAVEACSLAIEHGFRHVQFESDCLEVVRGISDNIRRGRWELYPLLCRIQDQLGHPNFEFSSWTWRPRSANVVADHIVNLA
ncbi:unnamed protein product [Prunus armeniaca]